MHHLLAAVAVSDGAEPEHRDGEPERVTDGDEVQLGLRGAEVQTDARKRDVGGGEREVGHGRHQDERAARTTALAVRGGRRLLGDAPPDVAAATSTSCPVRPPTAGLQHTPAPLVGPCGNLCFSSRRSGRGGRRGRRAQGARCTRDRDVAAPECEGDGARWLVEAPGRRRRDSCRRTRGARTGSCRRGRTGDGQGDGGAVGGDGEARCACRRWWGSW